MNQFASTFAAGPQPADAREITSSALWHLYDYDLENQLYSLMRIPEEIYRQASFLDQRVAQHRCPVVHYELRHLAGMFPRMKEKRSPMRFIFHVGHCGSTLLSRALATIRQVLPFREPMTLRSLSADRRELGTPYSFLSDSDWNWLLTTVLDTLSRSFRPDQTNVVKATSTGNNLIKPIMNEHPEHRAVLTYIPLESYLATMLADEGSAGDIKGQARTRMKDWLRIDQDCDFNIHGLKNPQLAALSWLTSMHHMVVALNDHPERLLMLDFEEFLREPAAHLPEVATFFGLENHSREIVTGYEDVAGKYSKQPETPYGPEVREQKLRRARKERADEIALGMEWAGTLAGRVKTIENCSEHFV